MVEATTRGMYFTNTLKHVEEVGGKAALDRLQARLDIESSYRTLANYSIVSLNRIQQTAAAIVYPGKSIEDAMYTFGFAAFESFASSMLGKVVLTMASSKLDRLGKRLPSYYGINNRFGNVSTSDIRETGFLTHFRQYRNYPQYHHGVFTCGLKSLGMEAEVFLTVRSFEDRGEGDIWTAFELRVAEAKPS